MKATKESKERGMAFTLKHERELNEFFGVMEDYLTSHDLPIVYDEKEPTYGSIAYGKYDTGYTIPIDITLRPALGRDEFILQRISIVAHEFGHWIDILDCERDWRVYEAQDLLSKEKIAWENAYKFLTKLGFDRFGRIGWRVFFNSMCFGMQSYYETELPSVDSEEAAHNFARYLMRKEVDSYSIHNPSAERSEAPIGS